MAEDGDIIRRPEPVAEEELLRDGDFLFRCVQRACAGANSKLSKFGGSVDPQLAEFFSWKETYDAFFEKFGQEATRVVLEMQELSLCPREEARSKIAQLRQRLARGTEPNNAAVDDTDSTDGDVSNDTSPQWSHLTFFKLPYLQAYLDILREPSSGSPDDDPQLDQDTLHFLEKICVAAFRMRVQDIFDALAQGVAIGVAVKAAHDGLTRASNIKAMTSDVATDAVDVRDFVEVLRFSNCPEPPRIYAEALMVRSHAGQIPISLKDHSSFFATILGPETALLQLGNGVDEHERPTTAEELLRDSDERDDPTTETSQEKVEREAQLALISGRPGSRHDRSTENMHSDSVLRAIDVLIELEEWVSMYDFHCCIRCCVSCSFS